MHRQREDVGPHAALLRPDTPVGGSEGKLLMKLKAQSSAGGGGQASVSGWSVRHTPFPCCIRGQSDV